MEEEKLRRYFKAGGFYVGDGLKYGADLLLYTDSPEKVHSKYAVLICKNHTFLQIMAVQRVCSSARKELVVAYYDTERNVKLVSVKRLLTKHAQGSLA